MPSPTWLLSDSPDAAREMAEWLQEEFYQAELTQRSLSMLTKKHRKVGILIKKGFSTEQISESLGLDIEEGADLIEDILKQFEINKASLQADPEARKRIDAIAKANALERTDGIPDLAERSFLWQANQANKESWYMYLDGEYDTLYDFMNAYLSTLDKDSRYYSTHWIITTMIPFLESQGADIQPLFSLRSAPTKARMIVPAARMLWEQYGSNKKKLTQELMSLITQVADPKVSTADLRTTVTDIRNEKILGSSPKETTKAGEVFVLPGPSGQQKHVLILEFDNSMQCEVVQRKLKKAIPEGFKFGDFTRLTKRIRDMISDPKVTSIMEE